MLLFCVALLLALGLVVLYSSSMTQVGAGYLAKQALWAVVGALAFAVAASMDYEALKRWAFPLFIVSIVLLALVYVPGLGIVAGKARRWLGHGSIRLQPSELAKVAIILALAVYGEQQRRRMPTSRFPA